MTDGISLHIKRLCAIERLRGTSEGLRTLAHRNSFANMLGRLDRPLPGNDLPSSDGASGSPAPVRNHPMQPFGVETVGRHPRRTAVPIPVLPGGAGEGQDPR
jgi:hypothetical protein